MQHRRLSVRRDPREREAVTEVSEPHLGEAIAYLNGIVDDMQTWHQIMSRLLSINVGISTAAQSALRELGKGMHDDD